MVVAEQGDWLQVRVSGGKLGWIGLWLVAANATEPQAHVFVSVHANAYFDRAVSGTETFYFRGKPNDAESRRLTAYLQAFFRKC